jgi:ribosomal protein S18 acetylase RimI-like enzyme
VKTVEIRPVKIDDDWNAISSIYDESWKYAYRGIIPQDYLDNLGNGRRVDKFKKALETNPNQKRLIVLDGDKIIATADFGKSRMSDMEGFGEVYSIYFLPEYMGKGYGKTLMQLSVDGLKEMGFTKMFLWVLEDNKSARHFYEKFGFSYSGTSQNITIAGENLTEMMYKIAF